MRAVINISTTILVAALLTVQLTACVPIAVGGAAVGGSMAADRRSSGIYIEDHEIEIKADNQISRQLGDKIHANVNSFNRNILITGEAYDEESKAKAESIAKTIENVKNITNELVIGPTSSLSSRSNDAYITSKVKANLLSQNRFPGVYVKVVTEKSSVFLMGIVTHKEAEDAADIARNINGVTKVTKVFEYMD